MRPFSVLFVSVTVNGVVPFWESPSECSVFVVECPILFHRTLRSSAGLPMDSGAHDYALRSLAHAQGIEPAAPASIAALTFEASGGRLILPDHRI
jgi:hypothetical protein